MIAACDESDARCRLSWESNFVGVGFGSGRAGGMGYAQKREGDVLIWAWVGMA